MPFYSIWGNYTNNRAIQDKPRKNSIAGNASNSIAHQWPTSNFNMFIQSDDLQFSNKTKRSGNNPAGNNVSSLLHLQRNNDYHYNN